MGNRADVAEILSQSRWSEEGSYLGEVAKAQGFPIIAKVIRGQYQNIGQPSFSNPSLFSHVLLFSAGKQCSVAAQCVKFKNCRQRVVPFGPTLSIPQGFEGHFEILSEDGRSVPCIQSVSGLTRKFPDSCLVREPIKAYKPVELKGSPPHSGSSSGGNNVTLNCSLDPPLLIGENPAMKNYRISDKTRVLQPGEILVLVGEVSVPSGKKVTRYLRCFDSKGQTVFLSSSQKGKFSPLARQDSISGVHTTKNILNKRMPMMVRLVDGKQPASPSSKSSSFKFVPELRLFSTIQEELIFGMPLSQSSKEPPMILPLPLSVPLKFQVCRNMGELEQMKEFVRLHERIKTLVDQTKNLIQIYDINLKKELRFDGKQWKAYAPPIFLLPSPSDPNLNNYEIPDVQDYEDIDQIYDYVRGIKPAPPRLITAPHHNHGKSQEDEKKESKVNPHLNNGTNNNKDSSINNKTRLRTSLSQSMDKLLVVDDEKPEPPPIETIPSAKNKAKVLSEKSKLYGSGFHIHQHHHGSYTHLIHNPQTQQLHLTNESGSSGKSGENKPRPKHLYVKHNSSSSGVVLDSPGGTGLISGSPTNRILFRRSPIFDCRYKSMNDLNRSSLESGGSGGSTHKLRYFQSHNHAINLTPNLNVNLVKKSGGSSRHKGIFRPKSLTNITLDQNGLVGSTKSHKMLDMVVPSHHHAIHTPPPPPLELLQKIPRSSQRQRQPPTLFL